MQDSPVALVTRANQGIGLQIRKETGLNRRELIAAAGIMAATGPLDNVGAQSPVGMPPGRDHALIGRAGNILVSAPTPIFSFNPVVLSAPGRAVELQIKVSAPARPGATYPSYFSRMAMESRTISPR